MDKYSEINEVLVRLFNEILDVEARDIRNSEFKDISVNDMHVIEAIGLDERKNMSSIAAKLSVTVGSLTIAMNGLVRKGYVIRERGLKDRRVVYIELSKKGREAYLHHTGFHRQMVEGMIDGLSLEEVNTLIKALNKIDNWMIKNNKF